MAKAAASRRILDPITLGREIGAGNFRAVYYFFGEEDYRKAEAVKHIVTLYLPQAQRMLNFSRLTVDKADFEAICGELASIPMLGERRVLFIDEVQRLKPTQQQKLLALLAPPPPETVVILSSPAERTPRKDSALFRDLGGVADLVQFDRLAKNAAEAKVTRTLEEAGLTCDREALNMLVEITDGDFGGLVGELEKLVLSVEPGRRIGLDEVKTLVSSHEQFTMFELIDSIIAHERDTALHIYNDLSRKGVRTEQFMGMLSGHMVNLLKAHANKKIAGQPFYVGKLRQQAREYDRPKVLSALARIAETERNIRRTKLKPSILVENLIREIAA